MESAPRYSVLSSKPRDNSGTLVSMTMVDPETGSTVAPLDVANAFKLVDELECVVHLLPQFRRSALSKYEAGGEEGVYLRGSSPGGGAINGMLLYSIERGRRGIVTFNCRILCVQDASAAIGRALIIPTAIMHKATRVVAKIYNKDQMQYSFWNDLGCEISEGMVQLTVDPDAIAAQRAAAARPKPPLCKSSPIRRAPTPADDLSQPAKEAWSSFRGGRGCAYCSGRAIR